MTQVAVSNTQPHLPTSLGLMSCVRESSPPLDVPHPEITRHESKRRRFHPLRGLRRIFGKKSRNVADSSTDSAGLVPDVQNESNSPVDPMRSRSTSQLSQNDPTLKGRGLHSSVLLSVSHDSVFTAESGGSEVETASSLSVQKTAQSSVRAELLDVVRRRKIQREDTSDDEDFDLPRSPPHTSPHPKAALPRSSHSTCSDESLLNMDLSERDGDNVAGAHNQSRSSLIASLNNEKKQTTTQNIPDADLENDVLRPQLDVSVAKYKMSIKPQKRRPGARSVKPPAGTSALPATPEVNEDISSHTGKVGDAPVSLSISQIKSSSLPVGSIPPTSLRLSRSRSNVTPISSGTEVKSSLSDDYLSDSVSKKDDGSFFSRLLLRRSGKKKKSDEASLPPVLPHKRMDEKGQYIVDINNISSKQYPSARQRVEPLNIPLEEVTAVNRMHVSYVTTLPEEEQVDSIQVAKHEPYLLRMYASQDVAEFKPVQKSYSFKQNESNVSSLVDTPSLPVTLTMPEIHSIPESETLDKDVLVDETVIENVLEQSSSSKATSSEDVQSSSTKSDEPHQIIISHKTDQPKPSIPQKPVACVIPVRPGVRSTSAGDVSPTSQVSKVFLNNEMESLKKESVEEKVVPNENSVEDETTVLVLTNSIHLSPEKEEEISPLKETIITSNEVLTSQSIELCFDKPPINPVLPRERSTKHLSLNLATSNSPVKDFSPSPIYSRRSVPSSPIRESQQKQRSPLKEISPFKIDSPKLSSKLFPSQNDVPSPYSPKRLSQEISSPKSKEVDNFFSDSSPVLGLTDKVFPLETSMPLKTREIPSPITPKDLILSKEISPTKVKENIFSKEIPSPIMPKDVFQFNTSNNEKKPSLGCDSVDTQSKIEKSSSFTEIKKEIPVPAPRISLRKDNSLPSMPQFMKVHVTTVERMNPLKKDVSDGRTEDSCLINVDSKKSMSSSCESLDMHDQIQSSSYSDSCDSMDNLDQWRNNDKTPWRNNKNESTWRNRYSEVSSSDSDDKQLSLTPDSSDIEKKIEEEEISIVQLRRKSFTKDWSISQDISPPRPLRQKSLEPELLKKDCNNMNEVVLRRKSLSKEMIKNDNDEPELLKVFARRSLKIPKDFDVNDNALDFNDVKIVSKDSDKENEVEEKTEQFKNGNNINNTFANDNIKSKVLKKNNFESLVINNKLNNVNTVQDEKNKSPQKEIVKPLTNNLKIADAFPKVTSLSEKSTNVYANKESGIVKSISNKNIIVETQLKTNEIKTTPIEVKSQNLDNVLVVENVNDKNGNTNQSTDPATDNVPRFKKIQQRREEWELRMQQARKHT